MKRVSSILSILIILSVVYWSLSDLRPSLPADKSKLKIDFSIDKALYHLKNISKKAHYVGSDGHTIVQNYIVDELIKLGLEPEIQTQTVINNKWFAATTTENIIARIKGTESGKALMLLSHYDSSPHSSLGASDAGSGVVTILEGIRVFLAKNKQPKNDIIILISDAEELGLLGAKAFVDEHTWANNIGLVLNFEARGSGGPSYMLLETNGKNGKLLSEFMKAKPNYPAASSLMYSVYKMIPNDTDLTPFREDANINGFNFAFIGDHFDYHTAQDTYERLDRETLLHQADYLTTSLNYFANSDLENLNSDEDFVYVNFPFTRLLTYPFSYVIPMLIIAVVLFVILIFLGISMNKITTKGVLKGFIPFVVAIILCGGVSFYGWKLLQVIHPQYKDMLIGFTYNGYVYILSFVFLNLWIVLKIYKYFKKQDKNTDLLVAPIFIWILINSLILQDFKGAGFFIIPVFCALLIFAISIFLNLEERSKRILFTFLSIPTIYIFAPMIKMFPVGLGLKSLYISGILIALIFGLLVLTFHQKKSNWFLKLCGFFTIIFFGYATYTNSFSVDNKKPNSLVYIQDSENKTAYYGTYNNTLDTYTKQVFDDTSIKGSLSFAETKSKYNTRFTYHKKTDYKNIISSDIRTDMDTVIGNNRFLEIIITPKRNINKLEFVTKNKITLKQFKVNDVLVMKGKKYTVKSNTFLSYTIANSDKEITLSFTVNKDQKLDILLNEISYDLLTNPNFSINPRSEEMMPTPFITNDAIIISKKLQL